MKRILGIGDSHLEIFEPFPQFWIYKHPTAALTASHIHHRFDWVHSILDKANPDDVFLFSMGEVDIRVFFENKIEIFHNKKTRKEVVEEVVEKYFWKVRGEFPVNTIVFYGPPASYLDKNKMGIRKQIDENNFQLIYDERFFTPGDYTNRQRNEVTKMFNDKLKELCESIYNTYFYSHFYSVVNQSLETQAEYYAQDSHHLHPRLGKEIAQKILDLL